VSNIKLKTQIIITLIIILSTLLIGCTNNNNDTWGDAPDFSLRSIDGGTFTLSDHIGTIIIIDLMATWCPPCIQQMSQLEETFNEFGNNIIIVSVDVDKDETSDDIKTTFGDFIDKWTFVLDDNKEDVAKAYEVSAIPKLIIIDKKGNIYYTHVGYMQYSALSEKIDKLLE
jgi:thiol-disulfide isomerase/thioredoxin